MRVAPRDYCYSSTDTRGSRDISVAFDNDVFPSKESHGICARSIKRFNRESYCLFDKQPYTTLALAEFKHVDIMSDFKRIIGLLKDYTFNCKKII